MEHNDMDKLFRDMIQNDDADLSNQEAESKVEIWESLDLPAKQVSFPFWKIAAALLFLLLGGTSWMMLNNINTQQEKYTALEEEYLKIKNTLLAVEEKLNQPSPPIQEEKINIAPSEAIAQSNTNTILEKEYIDRFVPVRDTIWIEKTVDPQQKTTLIRDTVYIEVEAKSPAKWTSLETPDSSKDSIIKKKGPSKVEFVFGKKELKKPEQKQKLFTIEGELVKKTKKSKRKILSTPNNN